MSTASIKSISCAVPARHFSILEYAPELLDERTAKRMTRSTGFAALRIAPDRMTASDLVVRAAEPILNDVDRSEIGAVVFVSRTQDYSIPATSHILQDRLRLGNDVLCLDINDGCSGWIKGLFTAVVIAREINRSVLLTTGDTSSRLISPTDRATRCLFGDAATATLISPDSHVINRTGGGADAFAFASFGERFDTIIVENSRSRKVEAPKNDGFMYVDGVEVMNFALNEVSELIEKFLVDNGLTKDDVSLYACHQANKRILTALADKLRVPRDIVPFVADEIGNTSSSSIPFVLTHSADSNRLNKILCCGFGVGLAIGVGLIDCSNTKFYGVSELE